MNPWLILMLVVVVLGGGLWWVVSQSRYYQRRADNNCLVFRPTFGGDLVWMILPLKGNEVHIPLYEDADHPRRRSGVCVIKKSAMFNMQYPIGTGWPPTFMRTTIKAVMIPEGSGAAWAPFDDQPVLSDETIAAMKKHKFLIDLVQVGYDQFQRRVQTVAGSVKSSHLMIAVIVIMLGLAGCGYGIYMLIQKQAEFATWMGM